MQDMNGSAERDGVIVLPDRLDIGAAARLRDAVLAATGDVSLDAGAVSMITTPGLQVVMAARDHLRADGRRLTLRNVSSGFSACAATLGVPLDRLATSEDRA